MSNFILFLQSYHKTLRASFPMSIFLFLQRGSYIRPDYADKTTISNNTFYLNISRSHTKKKSEQKNKLIKIFRLCYRCLHRIICLSSQHQAVQTTIKL